jgi:hypothetical protein
VWLHPATTTPALPKKAWQYFPGQAKRDKRTTRTHRQPGAAQHTTASSSRNHNYDHDHHQNARPRPEEERLDGNFELLQHHQVRGGPHREELHQQEQQLQADLLDPLRRHEQRLRRGRVQQDLNLAVDVIAMRVDEPPQVEKSVPAMHNGLGGSGCVGLLLLLWLPAGSRWAGSSCWAGSSACEQVARYRVAE